MYNGPLPIFFTIQCGYSSVCIQNIKCVCSIGKHIVKQAYQSFLSFAAFLYRSCKILKLLPTQRLFGVLFLQMCAVLCVFFSVASFVRLLNLTRFFCSFGIQCMPSICKQQYGMICAQQQLRPTAPPEWCVVFFRIFIPFSVLMAFYMFSVYVQFFFFIFFLLFTFRCPRRHHDDNDYDEERLYVCICQWIQLERICLEKRFVYAPVCPFAIVFAVSLAESNVYAYMKIDFFPPYFSPLQKMFLKLQCMCVCVYFFRVRLSIRTHLFLSLDAVVLLLLFPFFLVR